MQNQRTPISVLSDTFDTEKTTTLNHILNRRSDMNAAIFVNTMGDVDANADLTDEQRELAVVGNE